MEIFVFIFVVLFVISVGIGWYQYCQFKEIIRKSGELKQELRDCKKKLFDNEYSMISMAKDIRKYKIDLDKLDTEELVALQSIGSSFSIAFLKDIAKEIEKRKYVVKCTNQGQKIFYKKVPLSDELKEANTKMHEHMTEQFKTFLKYNSITDYEAFKRFLNSFYGAPKVPFKDVTIPENNEDDTK